MELAEIVNCVETCKCNLVEITGGEPLMQEKTPDLICMLLEKGYRVLLETNGSFDIDIVDKRCIRIMDIKCPSSRENKKNHMANLKKITSSDQIKFVISDRNDYCFAKKIIKETTTNLPAGNILFSPAYKKLSPDILSGWILEDNLNVRLHLQIHKIIWPDKQKGI